MDALDKTILEHLEFDGRSSMQDLSELTGLSRSAVFTRVKRMEDQGVIDGYTVRVNRKKLGMEIRAYCNITLKLHERELLEEFESNIGRHREGAVMLSSDRIVRLPRGSGSAQHGGVPPFHHAAFGGDAQHRHGPKHVCHEGHPHQVRSP